MMKPSIFEELKKINKYGQEYWSARDLAKILEYSEYRFFISVIEILLSGSVVKILLMRSAADSET